MNIFIVSTHGDLLELAEKLNKEGHHVSMYIKGKHTLCPKSQVEITKNPTAEMIRSELTIVEDLNSGEFVEKAKKMGRPVVGGGTVVSRLAKEPKFGTEVLKGCELPLAGENTKGILLEVGGWFTGEEFLKPYFIAEKYMRFGAGDVGPEIGPMGIVGQYKIKGLIFKESIEKTSLFLKAIDYVGYLGLDLYVNNNSLQVVGWVPGLQYPAVNLMTSLHNSFSTFLFKVAIRTAKLTSVQPDKIGVGVTWLELPWLCENPVKHRPRLICGTGLMLEEAQKKAYTTIHKTLKEDAYYRDDIGDNHLNHWEQLKKNEWL